MKLWYFYVGALFIFVMDQLSKLWIVRNLEMGEKISVIGEFFEITSHRNKGAAFGILQNQRWFFIVVTTIVLIVIMMILVRVVYQKRLLLSSALMLVLGGAAGNFWDRLLTGEVVDFLQFNFDFSLGFYQVDYTFAIFNLADAAIVVGFILILFDLMLQWRKERQELW